MFETYLTIQNAAKCLYNLWESKTRQLSFSHNYLKLTLKDMQILCTDATGGATSVIFLSYFEQGAHTGHPRKSHANCNGRANSLVI